MQGAFLPKSFDKYDVGGFSVDIQTGESCTEPHWHNGFEIIYIHSGSAELFFFDKWRTLHAGDVAILPPGYLHCVRCEDGATVKSVIGFTRELVDLGEGVIYAEDAESLMPSGGRLSPALQIIDALHGVDNKESECGRVICRGLILALWGRLLELWSEMGSIRMRGHSANGTVKRILGYISEHLTDEMSPYDVAASLGISYSHMARLLESENHEGFTRTVNRMRIDRAKKLLILGEGNVTEISYMVGFSDTSYFTKLFREFTGVTPLKYRKLAIGEQPI
ncbi:MAG: helix-turn-helix domain-containing protein [Clostridia bacterium]|nr:helix-turn-helix domain-containing protein [Clostridia bacterium]